MRLYLLPAWLMTTPWSLSVTSWPSLCQVRAGAGSASTVQVMCISSPATVLMLVCSCWMTGASRKWRDDKWVLYCYCERNDCRRSYLSQCSRWVRADWAPAILTLPMPLLSVGRQIIQRKNSLLTFYKNLHVFCDRLEAGVVPGDTLVGSLVVPAGSLQEDVVTLHLQLPSGHPAPHLPPAQCGRGLTGQDLAAQSDLLALPHCHLVGGRRPQDRPHWNKSKSMKASVQIQTSFIIWIYIVCIYSGKFLLKGALLIVQIINK